MPRDNDNMAPILVIIMAAVLLLLLLSGCSSVPKLEKPTTITPVCTALIGPIKYNSQKPTSRRFAGPDLAPDLKRRNQVGQSLRCPAYR